MRWIEKLSRAQRVVVVALGVAFLALGSYVLSLGQPVIALGWTGYAPLSAPSVGLPGWARLIVWLALTCLWAISGRDNVDFETWMKMDMQYIDNWSLALDWKILLQTIPRVLTGHGAN